RRLLSALQQARRLALGTGDMATAAKIAHLEFHETRDPELLAAEAIAWLDAGEPFRAGRVLEPAVRARLDDRALATLASAVNRDRRAAVVIEELEAQASGGGPAASQHLLLAARVARALGADRTGYEHL